MRKLIVALVVVGAVLVGAAVGIPALSSWMGQANAAINPCPDVKPVTVGDITVPRGPVAGFCQAQLENAAQVMRAAQAQGIGTHTQTVGVMTAIGESKLRNLGYGDDAGPDSRGIFQQRDNGAWGTYEQRMDPYTAASMFYAKLVKVPGWKTMTPTQMAHAVQINSDPDHYAKFWPEAKAVVEGLTGETVPDTAPQG